MALVFIYSAFIKGDQTYFDIELSGAADGTKLYPDLDYTTISQYLDTLLWERLSHHSWIFMQPQVTLETLSYIEILAFLGWITFSLFKKVCKEVQFRGVYLELKKLFSLLNLSLEMNNVLIIKALLSGKLSSASSLNF